MAKKKQSRLVGTRYVEITPEFLKIEKAAQERAAKQKAVQEAAKQEKALAARQAKEEKKKKKNVATDPK